MSRGRFRIVRNIRSRCGCGGAQVFECREKQSLHDSAPRVARDREKARRNVWSPGLMGGLTRGRGRSRNSRGIPKKKSCSLNSMDSALRVIRIEGKITRRVFTSMSNSAAGAISLQFCACNCLAWTLVFPKLLKIQPFVWNGTTPPG